jgi:MFS family permease
VAALTAPFAVILDAISYVVSAALIFAVRRQEQPSRGTAAATVSANEPTIDSPAGAASVEAESRVARDTEAGQRSVRSEVAEGLRFVLGHQYLRNIAATTGSSNLFSNILFSIFPVYVYVNLTLTPDTVGLIGGGFGAGALLGAFVAGRAGERLGIGHAIVVAIVVGALGNLAMPIASHENALWLIGGGGFFGGIGQVVYNVNQVSLRQAITPEPLLGRMNATMRFLVWGTIPIGQVIGGLIATVFGTHAAILVGAVGGLFAFLPVFFSPVRSLQRIPEPEAAPQPA